MKNIWHIIIYAALAGTALSCVRESLSEDPVTKDPFNIEAFSDGYSVAFELDLDPMGGDAATRADVVDNTQIEAWENYINPEEFRILFFDADDNFLFESKTRWFTQIEAHHGSSRWRVGVPIFPYLSDSYDDKIDDNISTNPDHSIDESYDWTRIAQIMRTQPFKIAILANRQSNISVPKLSDLTADQRKVKKFGKNGPFWSPTNSIASYDEVELQDHLDDIKTVFDLHHCQYDPFYENKNAGGGGDCYTFLFEYDREEMDDGMKKMVPYMGAVSGWLHPGRVRKYDGEKVRYFYRLPEGQILDEEGDIDERPEITLAEPAKQYIPMYGIQRFEPLTQWTKGTTYNLSGQVGSQTGDYDYKSISLLRSVVKLELRIPKYENGREVKVNNKWAQICASNFMARCEPMDVWTPTNEIWKDHTTDCEWMDIRNHGLYTRSSDTKTTDYKGRLSWYFGLWDKENKWDIKGKVALEGEKDGKADEREHYPHIFNPITQRLQLAFITDCYLPTDDYHRWIIYCGEKNMNDPNVLNDLTTMGYITYFRVWVKRPGDQGKIYYLPITDYSSSENPIRKLNKLTEDDPATSTNPNGTKIQEINTYPAHMNEYNDEVKTTEKKYFPYPLLRNHMYRLTVSFGNGDDIDVHILNGEKRVVGGIEFN